MERLKKPEPERTEPLRQWNPEAAEAAAEEGAPEAVGMGYHVIEEYLQQGRRTAEGLGLGLGGGLAAAGSFQALSARLLRDALVWLEHLARLTTPRDGDAPKPTSPGGHAPGVAGGFGIRVASAATVDVDLQLHPGSEGRAVGVHALRRADSDAEPIPVALVHAERWRVDLQVPAAQPHGLYTGIVYDRHDGSICGTVAVRVGEVR